MNVDLVQPSAEQLPMTALREAIDHAETPRELLNFREKAEVVRRLAERHDAVDLQYQASEAKLSCERRLGEMLREIGRKRRSDRATVGGPNGGSAKSLPDGISKHQSSTWQQLAALPEELFRKWIADRIAADLELTQNSLLTEAAIYIRKQQDQLDLNGGCGDGHDDDDVDDRENEDEDDISAYIDQTILRTTAAEKREVLSDLPTFQDFFGTDNLLDTVMALWRWARPVIQEGQE